MMLHTKGRSKCDDQLICCGRYIVPCIMIDKLSYGEFEFLFMKTMDVRPMRKDRLPSIKSDRTLNVILFSPFGTLHVSGTQTEQMVLMGLFEIPKRCSW